MRLIRWFITFVLLFAAAIAALMLLALLLVALGLLKLAGLADWIRPAPSAPSLARAPRSHDVDTDLPEAPPNVAIHHLRTWDTARNRASDRWYYKDAKGQWVFVRAPRSA
ncbi:MAG: hypothetical protein ABWZ80_09065 [Beijerinckiaceae bacterium]